MSITDSPRTGSRRWILTGALLLLTMIGTLIAVVTLPRSYQSESSVVLIASPADSRANGRNPFLSFSPSLTLTADVVSREVMAPSTIGSLAARGFSSSYTVAGAIYSTATMGSVLLVTVTGSDQAAVERTLYGVDNEINTILDRLQGSVPPANQIQAKIISVTGRAALSWSQTARSLVILAGFGLVLSFAIPWLADAQVAERRGQRAAGSQVPHQAEPVSADSVASPAHASRITRP